MLHLAGFQKLQYLLARQFSPRSLSIFIFIITFMLVAAPMQVAQAASIPVTIATDMVANDGQCSLREAVQAANTNAAFNGCPAGDLLVTDTITLQNGATYTLSIAENASNDDNLDGDLDFSDNLLATDLVINVAGGGTATINQTAADAVMDVLLGTGVEITGVTISGGNDTEDHSGGAGIFNDGVLTLNNVTMIRNAANSGAGDDGGAIYNTALATLTIANSTFSSNAANDGGGAIYVAGGTVTITGSTFDGNDASVTGGGALFIDGGSVTVSSSGFALNKAADGNSGTIDGGAIYLNGGTLTLNSNSRLTGNRATDQGGALFVGGTGAATITDTIFEGNYARTNGAAIANTRAANNAVNIQNSCIMSNTASTTDSELFSSSNTQTATNNWWGDAAVGAGDVSGTWTTSALGSAAAACSGAVLEIRPISWDVVGFDSNTPITKGPERYPNGFRVCNIGYADATNVSITWAWDSADTHIDLQVGSATTVNAGTLPVGTDPADGAFKSFNESDTQNNCFDAYFNIDLLRDANPIPDDHIRRYHVTATSGSAATVTTPLGRQLYIENLVEQARNDVFCISGPIGTPCPNLFTQQPQPSGQVVVVGQTYPFRMTGETAPGGYEQVVFMLDFPNNIFRVNSAVLDYSNPTALLVPDNNAQYADACGFSINPADAQYKACDGPEYFGTGGQEHDNTVGGQVTADYQVTILSAGAVVINGVIYDKSGASYHYNADFGSLSTQIRVVAVNAPTDALIGLAKTVYSGHNGGASCPGVDNLPGQIVGGNITYCFAVTNTGTSSANGGDVNLSSIVINDVSNLCTVLSPTLAPGAGNTLPIPPGGTRYFYCHGTYQGGTQTNVANASGTATTTDINQCTYGTLPDGFPYLSCPPATPANQVNIINPANNQPYGVTSPNDNAVTTPVTLSYFNTARNGNATHFAWSTAMETGNVGFNLYTAAADGSIAKINDDLIESKVIDSMQETDYKLTLNGVDGTIFYIEDVAINGDSKLHGPFNLGEAYGSQVETTSVEWDAISSESAAKADQRNAQNAAAALQASQRAGDALAIDPYANIPALRYPVFEVQVNQTGIYRITYEQLLAAGLDLAKVKAGDIAMSSRGTDIPIRVTPASGKFGPGSAIEFYGEALDTLYTSTNVYQLFVDKTRALRYLPDKTPNRPSGYSVAHTYMQTVTLNNQRAYGETSPFTDPFYDTTMSARAGRGPKTYKFTINVEGYVPNAAPATLIVNTYGLSFVPHSPDHHVVFALNGTTLDDRLFDGPTTAILNVTLPAGLLKEGANTLTITLPNDTGAALDYVRFDSASLTYPRRFNAQDGMLTFTGSGTNFQVNNLPSADVRVIRIENGKFTHVKVDVISANGTHNASFKGTTTLAKYVVAAGEALLTPTLVAPRPADDIRSGQASFLILSHPDFIAGLQPLVDARIAQGYTVRVVNIEDVYGQFSYGILDPNAIRTYIAYAHANMGTQYVLLVGGDTTDYRQYLSPAVSFIPTLYAHTSEIVYYAPADQKYADVNGDNVPDVALGRFPVRTAADLSLMVGKTLAYGSKDYGSTALISTDVDFAAESAAINAGLPATWATQSADLNTMTLNSARASLINGINNGVALTIFTGHSGKDRWTFSGLLNVGDAQALTNAGRPTIVVQWGCWNAYYSTASYEMLAQTFLLSGDRGAAAVFGATALADRAHETRFGVLFTPLVTQPGMTLGEAMRQAKMQLATTNPNDLDMLLGYTLLGDPTLMVAP